VKLCLIAGGIVVALSGERATLAWTHSVERQTWEEDWRATDRGPVVETARVRGSGAGMEPGADARLVDGAWVWHPKVPPTPAVRLARSGATADWRLCEGGACRPFEALLPANPPSVDLTVCDDEGRPLTPSGGTGR